MTTRGWGALGAGLVVLPALLVTTVVEAQPAAPAVACLADVETGCEGSLQVSVSAPVGVAFDIPWSFSSLSDALEGGSLSDPAPSAVASTPLVDGSSYILNFAVSSDLLITSLVCDGVAETPNAPNEVTFTYAYAEAAEVDCVLAVTPKASLQINKTSNGGEADFDFSLTELGDEPGLISVATSGSPVGTGSTTRYLRAGTYSLSEDLNGLWLQDSFTCTGPDGAFDPSEFDVVLGEHYECDVVNRLGVYVEIQKNWNLPEDDQPASASFYWDGDSEATFEVPTDGGYSTTLEPGNHTLTEAAGEFEVDLYCDIFDIVGNYLGTVRSNGEAQLSFEAEAGERYICFATNTPPVRVHVSKSVDATTNPAPTFEFSSGDQSVSVEALRPSDATEPDWGTLVLPSGTIVVTEHGPAGWEFDDASCVDADENAVPVETYITDAFSLSLKPGQEVWCTVANRQSISVEKTLTEFTPGDEPGTYAVSWDVAVHNPLAGSLGGLTLTDELDLHLGIDEITDIEVIGPDGNAVEGWNGVDATVLADNVGIDANETLTWQVSLVVSTLPNLPTELLECALFPLEDDGGFGNRVEVGFGGLIYSSDYVCADLPAADLAVEKDAVSQTDNGDGTWTQTYEITVSNTGAGYAEVNVLDTLLFGLPFAIESVTIVGAGPDVVIAPYVDGPIGLFEGLELGAEESVTVTVEVVFAVDLNLFADLPDGYRCEFVDGQPSEGHGLYNEVVVLSTGLSLDAINPVLADVACVDGPSNNVWIDKTVAAYNYIGNDTIVVDFDIVATNVVEEGADVLAGVYQFLDFVGFQSPTIEAVGFEVVNTVGFTVADPDDSPEFVGDIATLEVGDNGVGGQAAAIGLIQPGSTHTYRVRVTYLVDVEGGFTGTCPTAWDFADGLAAPGGAVNAALWTTAEEFNGFEFPENSLSAQLDRRTQRVEPVPRQVFGDGISIAYDCLDLGAVGIEKTVTNDDGGTAEPDDFSFFLERGDGVVEREVEVGVPTLVVAGEYTLVEGPAPDYVPGNVACRGFDFSEFELEPNEVKPFIDGRTARTQSAATPGRAQLEIEPSWGWVCSITNDDKPADLTVTKNDGGVTAVAGGAPITYTFLASNKEGFLTGDATLTDELPEGWSWVPDSVTGCASVTIIGRVLECVVANDLLDQPDDMTTVTAEARVAADAASGDYLNMVVIDSESDPAPEEPRCNRLVVDQVVEWLDAGCDITPVVREASMSATKTSNAVGPVAIGGSVVFTLTVTNEGPSTVLAGTTLVDDLPAGLNLISINAPGWTCNAVDPVVCEYGSVLAVGETAPAIQVTTTVAPGASGTITNTGVFTGIVDVEEAPLDPSEVSLASAPVVVTATAVASAVAVIQVRSGGTIPETGADSLGWLPVASLLVVAGVFGLLLARRRRPAAAG